MYSYNLVFILFYCLAVNTMATEYYYNYEYEYDLEFEDGSTEIDCKNGTKLTEFVCLLPNYYKTVSPKFPGETSVQINSSISLKEIREVNVYDRYMTFDVLLHFYWVDNRITKKFAKENMDFKI